MAGSFHGKTCSSSLRTPAARAHSTAVANRERPIPRRRYSAATIRPRSATCALAGCGSRATESLPTTLPTILEPTEVLDDVLACLQSGGLTSPECQQVLAAPEKLLRLQEECAKRDNEDKAVCQQLAAVPGLPTGTASVPPPTSSALLPTLPTVPGLPRAPTGEQRLDVGGHGPTMRQLMGLYDASLVRLLVPAMVVPGGGPR